MQLMSIWNAWIMIINIKIMFHSNAIIVHLKYIMILFINAYKIILK